MPLLKRLLRPVALLLLSQLGAMAQAGPPPRHLQLYLLAGQSNMAGRGAVAAVDQTPHPRVWMLNQRNEWVPATEPMHFDKPTMVGVGPGLAFGKLLAEQNPTAIIGLIPTAVGGTSMDAWQPGGYDERTKTHPYDDALRRVREAQKSGTLRGIIWHQGESDSKPELVGAYQAKLIQLIGRFRQAFHARALPVVVGTLSDSYVKKTPAAAQINSILRELPQHVARLACVESAGLTDRGDQTHFDGPSARVLGERYAQAMLKLAPARKTTRPKKGFSLGSRRGEILLELAETERQGVHRAAADLVADIFRVSGKTARIVPLARSGKGNIRIGTVTSAAPFEQFALRSASGELSISGHDERATIFGIYHFAEHFLGINPMAFWSDKQPAKLPASIFLAEGRRKRGAEADSVTAVTR